MLDGDPTVPETQAASPATPSASPDTSTPSAAPPSASPRSTDEPDQPDDGPGTATPCGDDGRSEMRATVLAQLEAIRAGDWAEALTFTTTRFRADVDEAAFERIIVDGFPVVARSVAADATLCLLGGDAVASLAVTVEDGDGAQQDLVYLFEQEDGAWRIGGAVPDTDGERDDDSITV